MTHDARARANAVPVWAGLSPCILIESVQFVLVGRAGEQEERGGKSFTKTAQTVDTVRSPLRYYGRCGLIRAAAAGLLRAVHESRQDA